MKIKNAKPLPHPSVRSRPSSPLRMRRGDRRGEAWFSIAVTPPGGRHFDTGYTLLEVLIALGIFLMVIVPLTAYVSNTGKTVAVEQKLTATCILDQEAARIKAFPADIPPERRRQVAGREYLVKTESSGTGLKSYTVTVTLAAKQVAMVRFMNFEGEK